MTTLTDFLLERIAEDEAPTFEIVPYACEPDCCAPAGWVGRRCLICDVVPVYGGTVEAITEAAREHDEDIHHRARVLAECRAKRIIVERHATSGAPGGCYICSSFERETVECFEQRALATIYADHPAFDPEWAL